MINFEELEEKSRDLNVKFVNALPFSFVAIDGFCNDSALNELLDQMPDPGSAGIGKSRDYIFAKNKFEKSNFRALGSRFEEIYQDFTSDRFKALLQTITGRPLWVDPAFHGGGIHQGGTGSYLDMHVDFSHHPLHPDWQREVNVLLYLNRGWKPEYRGHLDLRNRETGAVGKIEPLFNRCVIMLTKAHTMHGYAPIAFPDGEYRRSIATYAYQAALDNVEGRSTTWFPDQGGALKQVIGNNWPRLVAIKTKLFGSGTRNNQ